jgi:hypothetical protein
MNTIQPLTRCLLLASLLGTLEMRPVQALPSAPAATNPFDDPDGDGLSNAEEASRGTRAQDPQNDVDTDGDGLGDSEDAVPLVSEMKVPAAPEVGYVAISLTGGSSNSGVYGVGLNDRGEVLLESRNERAYYLWRAGEQLLVAQELETMPQVWGPLADGTCYVRGPWIGRSNEVTGNGTTGLRAWPDQGHSLVYASEDVWTWTTMAWPTSSRLLNAGTYAPILSALNTIGSIVGGP